MTNATIKLGDLMQEYGANIVTEFNPSAQTAPVDWDDQAIEWYGDIEMHSINGDDKINADQTFNSCIIDALDMTHKATYASEARANGSIFIF